MGRPVGSILEVIYKYTACGQVNLNVFHYAVSNVSSKSSVQEEQTAFLSRINALNQFTDKMKQAMSNEATLVEVSAQFIRTTRFARTVQELGLAGTIASECLTANTSAVITKRTEFAGQWAIGRTHIGGMPANGYDGGLLVEDYKDLVEAIAAYILTDVTVSDGAGVYTPVLLHPPAEHGGATGLESSEVQDTVRVMRRRTVGLGI